jgi:hypothetical protein
MPIQYGVLLGLWDTKPIFLLFFTFTFFFLNFFFNFLSIYISIVYLYKKVAYGGRISIYSPDHGLVSWSLILAVASMTEEVDPIDHHGLWLLPVQYVWTTYLNEYSKYLGSELV